LNIERAHYYGGFGQMSFFTVDTSNVGVVTIYPGAWALKAHSQLSGGTLLGLSVCDSSNNCQSGVSSATSPLQATAVLNASQVKMVVSNDSATSNTTTIQIKNWTGSSSPSITQTSYPTSSVTVSAPLSSSVYTVSSTSATTLLSNSTTVASITGSVSGSTLTAQVTVPSYQALLLNFQ
jgi:hypothetical protein